MEKAKILIVEDEAIIAMEIQNTLQVLGYEVTSIVNSSEKALIKTADDKPDLILMDIRIKGDKDGIETAEIIRSDFGIPVVFSTAYLDKERINRVKITMPFGYVLKPIQERDLTITLEMALWVAKIDEKRRQVEEVAHDKISFLNRIMDQGPFAMWISNTDGTIIKTNKKLREILNLTDDQPVGRYNVFLDNNLKDQGLMSKVRAVYKHKEPIKLRFSWESAKVEDVDFKGSRTIWIEASFFPIEDKSGNLKNVVCQWIDITEFIYIEMELKRYKDNLEDMVRERTTELAKINDQLQKKLEDLGHTESK